MPKVVYLLGDVRFWSIGNWANNTRISYGLMNKKCVGLELELFLTTWLHDRFPFHIILMPQERY